MVEEGARLLARLSGLRPRAHLVLGSGLGGLAARVEDAVEVPFSDLAGFPKPTVEGHAGRFVCGRLAGVEVLLQAGRYHFYEGVGADVVLAPVRVGRALGAEALIVTNAAGGIRADLAPGSVMLVCDHLDLSHTAPLAGPARRGEQRFPDLSRPYDPGLMKCAETVALKAGVRLARGVYGMVSGPAFETAAEVLALRAAGADVVGMSTVPEVTAARAGGQRVLAFSVVTNRAAGLGVTELDHEEVMEWGAVGGRELGRVVAGVVRSLAD